MGSIIYKMNRSVLKRKNFKLNAFDTTGPWRKSPSIIHPHFVFFTQHYWSACALCHHVESIIFRVSALHEFSRWFSPVSFGTFFLNFVFLFTRIVYYIRKTHMLNSLRNWTIKAVKNELCGWQGNVNTVSNCPFIDSPKCFRDMINYLSCL